jgi:hypothetical protein
LFDLAAGLKFMVSCLVLLSHITSLLQVENVLPQATVETIKAETAKTQFVAGAIFNKDFFSDINLKSTGVETGLGYRRMQQESKNEGPNAAMVQDLHSISGALSVLYRLVTLHSQSAAAVLSS